MTGQIISHYRILEQLGSGGMGVVYKAEDRKLGRQVALKFLSDELSQQQAWIDRFQREARSASALNHPNICTIYEIDEHEGRLFIAMELLEGHSLRDEVDRPLPTERVLDLAIQIAGALQAAHAKGIIHRDLKSANIFVTKTGPAKLLDFGLAKFTHVHGGGRGKSPEDNPPPTETLMDSLTDPGLIIGTVPYMSPEQLLGQELDHRTDIFSLGVVLYQMATGKLPFQGNTAPETIMHIARDEPQPMEGVTLELQRIIRKCLEKDRERRYRTAEELLANLRQFASARKPELSALVRRYWRGLAVAGFAALILVVALAWNPGGWLSKLGVGKSPHIESLAVLPLANLSGDPSQDFFADGMTEALSAELGQIKALKKVISRTSVMRYKGTNKPLRQIAQELGVDGVIEASVARSGNRVRITAKLIDAASDNQVWARTYERDMVDILSLETDVARSIVTEIQTQLTELEQTQLARVRQVNPDAYVAFLKGRYYWDEFKEESILKSLDYFKEAIQLDPNYAEAYAGLANVSTGLYIIGAAPAGALADGRTAAEKTLMLDDSLSDGHAELAVVENLQWNFTNSEKEFKRALELNPSDVHAHIFYTTMLRHEGRAEESLAQAKRALELDPLSLLANEGLADAYLDARQYDRALEQYRKALDLYPDHPNLHYYIGLAYVYKGMYDRGIEEIQRSLNLEGADLDLSADLAYAYSRSGKRDKAEKILQQLLLFSKESTVPPSHFAIGYIALGQKDLALEWLEKAYQEHAEVMQWLKVDPRFDSLRKDPRFIDLMHRVGLP